MPPFSPESSKMKDYKRWGKTITYALLFVFIIVMLYCLFHLHVFVAQKHIRTGRAVPMAIVERNSGLVLDHLLGEYWTICTVLDATRPPGVFGHFVSRTVCSYKSRRTLRLI
ncbi:hypothetical protein XENOCAPTIV_022879 [Xenoophorus captivus]|uniref:Uncharacterized protein n=1 Tax=Xenoophorus captivus TaxID=1517983 RepID=A0ABV0RUB9_9TELE